MTIDLANIDPRAFPYLEICSKTRFDADTITQNAEQLKYISEIKKFLTHQFKTPDTDWVKHIATRVTTRRMTSQVLDTFQALVETAQSQFLKDEANRRLRSAQDYEDPQPTQNTVPDSPHDADNAAPEKDGIVTTDEEIQAFGIIRAIYCNTVPTTDITLRDAKPTAPYSTGIIVATRSPASILTGKHHGS